MISDSPLQDHRDVFVERRPKIDDKWLYLKLLEFDALKKLFKILKKNNKK